MLARYHGFRNFPLGVSIDILIQQSSITVSRIGNWVHFWRYMKIKVARFYWDVTLRNYHQFVELKLSGLYRMLTLYSCFIYYASYVVSHACENDPRSPQYSHIAILLYVLYIMKAMLIHVIQSPPKESIHVEKGQVLIWPPGF